MLVRDVCSMALGGWLAVHEALAADPNGGVLLLALALTVPGAGPAVVWLLGGPGGGRSLPAPPPSGESLPGGSREAAGETVP